MKTTIVVCFVSLVSLVCLYYQSMSLYRTYRPRTFADVVGQDHVVTTLENAVEQAKLTHAYLFAGSRGTGKTSVARILAKAMLTQGITDEKIRKQIDIGVDDGSLVDLVEIDGASNRGIDDIRSLVEKIQFSPVAAAAKVYIIDEVHMLTKEAFNALLKTLEEPPNYAYFILATTELQKIPATIQSRCQRFAFRQIAEDDIIRRLQFIADQEHISVDRTALRAIAHHADGAVRDAISLMDQLRALPKITIEDVKERTGEAGHEIVEEIIGALEASDQKQLLALVHRMESTGLSLEAVTRSLLGKIRAQLHRAIDEDRPIAPYTHMLNELLETLRDMRIAPVPGLVLESTLISLCSDDAPVIEKPKAAKTGSQQTATSRPSTQESPAPVITKEVEADEAIVEAPELSVNAVRDHWPQLVRDISPASLKMSLKNGHVHALTGNKVTLAFASTFHRDKVAKTDSARIIEQTLENVFKRTLRIECILEEQEKAKATTDKDMVNLAEAASEVF